MVARLQAGGVGEFEQVEPLAGQALAAAIHEQRVVAKGLPVELGLGERGKGVFGRGPGFASPAARGGRRRRG